MLIALWASGCGGGESDTTPPSEASSSTTSQSTTLTADGTGDSTEFLGATLTAATAGEPGVVVIDVEPGSVSRLKVGDVIVSVDGEPVADPDELIDAVGETELGDQFKIRVVRGSKRISFIEVQSPSAFLGTQVKDAPGDGGAAVVTVAGGSPAEKAGIEKGDVLVAVDGTPVRSGDELVEAVAAHSPGDEVTVTATRGSDEVELSVTLVRNPGIGG